MDETSHIPLEKALGVKGKVRLRPYGSVKHPHFVLRQVDEEEYEDSSGKRHRRAIFSFFAHKLINVKPGKELFMCVQPFGDELQERVVTVEADISDEGEAAKDLPVDKKSDSSCLQREQTLPPKLRKLLGRKSSSPLSVGTQGDVLSQKKVSVGVQVDLATLAVEPRNNDIPMLVPEVQIEPSKSVSGPSHLETDQGHIPLHATEEINQTSENITTIMGCKANEGGIHSSNDQVVPLPHRSLSPMEIESASSSPEYSPARLVLDLPVFNSETGVQNQDDMLPPDSLPPASVIHHVNSPVFPLKLEPEEIALPPSPSLRSQSASSVATSPHTISSLKYREPTFVPAMNPQSYISPSLSTSSPKQLERGRNMCKVHGQETTPHNSHEFEKGNEIKLAEGEDRGERIVHAGIQRVPSPDKEKLIRTPVPTTAPIFAPSSSPPPTTREASCSIPTQDVGSLTRSSTSSSLESQLADLSSLQNLTSTSYTHLQYHAPPPRNRKKRKRSSKMTIPETLQIEGLHGNGSFANIPPEKKWKLQTNINSDYQAPSWITSSDFSPTSCSQFSERLSLEAPQTLIPHLPPYVPSPQSSSTPTMPTYSNLLETGLVKSGHAGHLSSLSLEPSKAAGMAGAPVQLSTVFRSPISTDRVNPWPIPDKPPKDSLYMRLPSLGSSFITFDGSGRESGVNSIVYNMAGDLLAIVCRDSTIRIWSNTSRSEMAKLTHNTPVKSVVWLEDNTYSPVAQPLAIASLGTNGIVNKWTLTASNIWEWSNMIDTGDERPSCLAYYHGLIAVSNPRRGIRLWKFDDVIRLWKAFDRVIPRKDVVSIKFANDGNELLCAGVDGSVFRTIIPELRIQSIITFKTKVFSIVVDSAQSSALISRACGRAHLVDISQGRDGKPFGNIIQDYIPRDVEQNYGERVANSFGAIFASRDDLVIYGTISGRILVWDRQRGCVTYELVTGQDVTVQAVASYDGRQGEQYLVSCTRQGVLTWWELPIRLY